MPLGTLAAAVLPFAVATQPVAHDADDPAIWIHPSRPELSRVYGTDKFERDGGIYVFDTRGRIIQRIRGVNRPNNIDVAYGLAASGRRIDILVATERLSGRLRVFSINRNNGFLTDITGNTNVSAKGIEGFGEPMGIGLYTRPSDRAIYAIVAPKTGLLDGYLEQYQLRFNPATNRVDTRLVRRFGAFSGQKEIEAITVDNELNRVYYSDEGVGVHVYPADPASPRANDRLHFIPTPFRGDTEGLAVWKRADGAGYLLVTEQIENGSRLHVFRREDPQNKFVVVIPTKADETDGIEVTSKPMGGEFWCGMLVMMDSKNKRFLFTPWSEVERFLYPRR